MNKRISIIFICFIFLLVGTITNPNKSDYINWATEKIQSQGTGTLQKGLLNFFGEKMVSNTTTSKNFIMFSIYSTDFGDEKLTTLGLFKNFITIDKQKVDNVPTKTGAK